MDEQQAKNEIQNLIDDLKAHHKQYETEEEANTETKLIEPLFNVLGWSKNDFEKRAKVRRGNKRGVADYAFKIDGRTVFFLEAKRVGIPLEKEADKQVISYALSKRIPFAVSTNFEELKIFCVEQEDAVNQVFRVFTKPEDLINKFQNLLLLSKESFQKNLTLKEAEDEGRLKKRASIDKALLDDLMQIRKLIAEDIEKTHPKKYEINEKEEIIQRIIDRLIFIRRCEDTEINPENLYLYEVGGQTDEKAHLNLKEIFSKYNQVYNSGLFAINIDNDLDKIKISGAIIKKLIDYLYESHDKQYVYNFDWIDADVLGQVYEQYLGKILEQTKSGKTKLREGQAHRKEQGIYYTPAYIVDYIVKNTVLEVLKNKKKSDEIKVLDPACGSGSFLIKAFDYLYNDFSKNENAKYQMIDSQGAYSIKTKILKRNIYGVDLDNKAVEITKLNLLLKASEKGRKLPEEIDLHIKHGNSVVEDEKATNLHPFKWVDDFKEDTFDVVIGNPPYVDYREIEGREFIKRKFYSAQVKGKYNLLILFLEKGLKVLRSGGRLGFIVSNQFLCSDFGINIRKFILENSDIKQIIDVSMIRVFRDASTYPIIIILEKKHSRNNVIKVAKPKEETDLINNALKFDEINQNTYLNFEDNLFILDLNKINLELINKMKNNSKQLKDCVHKITWGTSATGYGKKKIKQAEFSALPKTIQASYKKIIQTSDIQKYNINWQEEYIPTNIYTKNKIDLFNKDKIVIGRLNKFLKATIDVEKYFLGKATLVIPKIGVNPKFLLGVINSKLIDYYFKLLFQSTHMSQGYIRYDIPYLEKLPIKITSEAEEEKIIKLVDKILLFNNQLKNFGDKVTSETKEINERITKLDREINQRVYEIYGLNSKEIELIENF